MSGNEPLQRTGLFSRIFTLFTGQQLWSAPVGTDLQSKDKDGANGGSIFDKLGGLNINGDNNNISIHTGDDKADKSDKEKSDKKGVGDTIEINGDNNNVSINGKDKTDKSSKSDKSSSGDSKQDTMSKIIELLGKLVGKMDFNS